MMEVVVCSSHGAMGSMLCKLVALLSDEYGLLRRVKADFFLDNGLKFRLHLPNGRIGPKIQRLAQIEESCRNKVTALKISNNRNKVFNYAAPTLLRESQPLEWKNYNAEDSRCLAACTSSSRRSS